MIPMEVYAVEIDELKQKIAGLEDQLGEATKGQAVLSSSADGLCAEIPGKGKVNWCNTIGCHNHEPIDGRKGNCASGNLNYYLDCDYYS